MFRLFWKTIFTFISLDLFSNVHNFLFNVRTLGSLHLVFIFPQIDQNRKPWQTCQLLVEERNYLFYVCLLVKIRTYTLFIAHGKNWELHHIFHKLRYFLSDDINKGVLWCMWLSNLNFVSRWFNEHCFSIYLIAFKITCNKNCLIFSEYHAYCLVKANKTLR